MRHSEAVDKTTIQDQAAEVERLEGIVSKAESAMTSALHTEGNWRAHLTGYFAAAEQAKEIDNGD